MLLVRRLTSLASTLATDPALSTVALDRLMYLVTRYEDGFDQTQFDALVSQYRPEELDVVILRAVADAIETTENKPLDTRPPGGA
jgi:hypothetical protein